MPASTVHAVLTRHGLHRLAWLDRPTGQLIRRYERDRHGELIHVDVKRLGRVRDGGGWRILGRDSLEHRRARTAGRVMTDNALAYRRSRAWHQTLTSSDRGNPHRRS